MPTQQDGDAAQEASGRRWSTVILAIATIAAISGVVALLIQRQTTPGIEVSLPVATPPPPVMIYVSGAVANPGVYEFQEGDRLQDVMLVAGGLLQDADPSAVNLSALLEDQQHYHFPKEGETLSIRR